MAKRDLWSVLVFTACGFLGGTLASLGFPGSRSFAAEQTATVIRAQRFEVVNAQSQVVGELGLEKNARGDNLDSAELTIRDPRSPNHRFQLSQWGVLGFDANGKTRIGAQVGFTASPDKGLQGSFYLLDEKGKDTWRAE